MQEKRPIMPIFMRGNTLFVAIWQLQNVPLPPKKITPGYHEIYTHISVPCRPISHGIYTRVFFSEGSMAFFIPERMQKRSIQVA